MSNEEFSPSEQALQYAARLKGLELVRTGNTYALAEFRLNGATLDEIAAFLAAYDVTNDDAPEVHRRSGLQALLKAEHHAMLAELEAGRRNANKRGDDRLATEAALAEIRRRIMELSKDRQASPSSPARRA